MIKNSKALFNNAILICQNTMCELLLFSQLSPFEEKKKKKISQVIHFSHFTIKVNRTRQLPATPISFLTTSNTRLVITLMSVTVGRQKNKAFTDKHPVLVRQDLSHRLGTRQRNDRCQAAGVTLVPTVTSLCMTKKKYLDCHRVWSALNLVVQGFLQVR